MEITSNTECQCQLTIEDFQRAIEEEGAFVNIITAGGAMLLYNLAKKHAKVRCIEQILVENVMVREIVTTTAETALATAAELMVQNRISGLPVISENFHLIGVLTETDLLKCVGIPNLHESQTVWERLESLFLHKSYLQGFQGAVREHMTTPAITVEMGSTLEHAVDMMKKRHVRRLMVVDSDEKIQGVICRSDIIRVFLDQIRQLTD
ncbi:MAG: CBS domain-containing protein [Magnetococcales bacterium]|nr:CBS domain-containing protein [Magnetococcales bacterium]